MKHARTFTLVVAMLGASAMLFSCDNNKSLPRGGEEEFARFDKAGDQVFHDVWAEGTQELHSLMILKDGKVVYEKYAPMHTADELHVMWSGSKTFTATAIGFAEQDGLLSTEDKVVDYFPEELPEEPCEWLQELTIHDLLIMSSGFHDDHITRPDTVAAGDSLDWARKTLASPFDFRPGTMFHYNSLNSYLLSVIVSRVTGKKLVDYLDEKLFTPLGIEEFYWSESPQGYNAGGWGLFISTESFAKMGQFMLQRGKWNGKQLLFEEWFDRATTPQIMQHEGRVTDPTQIEAIVGSKNPWTQGYAYQMWCCADGAYRLDGAWAQLSIVFPEQNAVVTTTAHTSNAARLIASIWEHIFPLLGE